MDLNSRGNTVCRFIGNHASPRVPKIRCRPVPLIPAAACLRPSLNSPQPLDLDRNPDIISLGELRAEKSSTTSFRPPVSEPRVGASVVLELIDGPHQGAQYEFDFNKPLVVGRSRGSKLRLKRDLHLSRHHFLLKLQGSTCRLIDLESLNGTRVNDVPVQNASVKTGDIISAGKTRIRVSIS